MIVLHPRETGGAPARFDPAYQRWNAKTRQVEPLAAGEAKANLLPVIKAEARNRILARFPEWKQANMTARGVEADALAAAWGWIKSVRVASDALEAMNPIPRDFAEDKYWPS